MKDILSKISNYNLFNYFFPGILFAFIVSKITDYKIVQMIQSESLISPFVYYFLGMAISRFGSVVVEWILKKTAKIQFAEYKDFIKAERKDEKLALLLEVNNTYRTLFAAFLLILFIKGYSCIAKYVEMPQGISDYVLIALLAILFAFAFAKQAGLIKTRVEVVNNLPSEETPQTETESRESEEKEDEETQE